MWIAIVLSVTAEAASAVIRCSESTLTILWNSEPRHEIYVEMKKGHHMH